MDSNSLKPLIISLVGLPARGKSYISRKLNRYFYWLGIDTKVFNIGNYRRKQFGVEMNFEQFFDSKNEDNVKARDECCIFALKDIIEKITNKEIVIAILDGTNTTIKRRNLVRSFLNENLKVEYDLLWLESICNITEIIDKNIVENKLRSADYIKWDDKEKAKQDFLNRIKKYEEVYEEVNENSESMDKFVKIINQGEKVIINKLSGFVESKLVSYLMNIHTQDRSIYFSRHGESEYNLKHLIGGDSSLSQNGIKYAKLLGKYLQGELKGNNAKLYCSTLKRTIQTSQVVLGETSEIFNNYISLKILDEIDAGLRDGFTYKEIEDQFPDEFYDRENDKLNYRYPRGESYMDLIKRIEPMIYEIERSKQPLVIIGHQAMLRCLFGYFADTLLEDIPTMNIPLNTVIKFSPKDSGYVHESIFFDLNSEEYKPIDINVHFNECKFTKLFKWFLNMNIVVKIKKMKKKT